MVGASAALPGRQGGRNMAARRARDGGHSEVSGVDSDSGKSTAETVDVGGVRYAVDTVGLRSTWDRQSRFLAEYAKCRTKATASKAAGVNRDTVHSWEVADKLGFRHRLAASDELFTDSLEDFAHYIARQLGPKNSPLLLITLLNRHLPHLYRPNVLPTDEKSKEVLKEIRQLVGEEKDTPGGRVGKVVGSAGVDGAKST